jgi:hypothetical protein
VTSTIYLDTAAKVARAALTGTALPSVTAKLLSHLQLIIKAFDGADIITVDADTMRCVIKPKNAPAGDPALIDTTAVLTGTGETAQYVFEWPSADSVELRAHIDAAADPTQPQELRCEVEYELDGNVERVAFPIHFETAYTRPEDPAPEANTDTSWEWLKLRAPEANGFTHDDEAKELTVAGGSGSGDVVGPSSSTDSRPALFNGTTGKLLKQASAVLGDAAFKATGTSAGTVAAGDDSRLSDARTPTAHAASHVTGGTDAIQSATSAQNGLATSAHITKLDGIEALADVTDAANVGSAIHGATAKTTPADADTVGLIDSAASNVLKKLSWTNIKATLKSYFDGFYLLKTIYDPQNAGKISGADGADEDLYGGASGGTGGTLSMDGGNTSTFMESAIAGGSAGTINTSGGSADGGSSGGTGGSINTSGSAGYSGGNIDTTGGGSITTGGDINTTLGGSITTGGGSITSGSGNVNLGNTSGTLQPHALSAVKCEYSVAVSDESTALTTGTAKVTFRMPFAMTLTSVRASVTTAPTGSTLVVDINESGSTILSTKLSIDASEKTSVTAATAAVISDTGLADDAEMTIDIDQIGSTIAGAGIKVTFIGTRA